MSGTVAYLLDYDVSKSFLDRRHFQVENFEPLRNLATMLTLFSQQLSDEHD